MTTGEKIRFVRTQHSMTQEELGKRLGVSKSLINKYENGVIVNLKRTTIKELADILGVSPTWLAGLDDIIPAEAKKMPQISPTSEEEAELLRIYRRLPIKYRIELLSSAYAMEDELQK